LINELVHVTVGYPRIGLMALLEASSIRSGCRFVCLPRRWGVGQTFTLFTKLTLLKSYLDSGDVGLDQVVLFTDAYDVLVVEDSGQILEKFWRSGADIVFSGESNFYPAEGRENIRAEFDKLDSKWRYINSGTYIGYVWALKRLVDYCVERIGAGDYDRTKAPNDQPIVQEFFLNGLNSDECRMLVDVEPEIFCCINASSDDFAVSKSRIRRAATGRSVSILHANGGKYNLDILERYWRMIEGDGKAARFHDLRVATVQGQPLKYDPESKKLVPTHIFDENTVVFVVRGGRLAIAVSAAHGLMTLTAAGLIHVDASSVGVWEISTVRDLITSFHGLELAAYCNVQEGATVTITAPLLTWLRLPAFPKLLDQIAKYDQTF